MPTSPNNFKASFDEALLSFLWRQWSALGVAGGQTTTTDPWLVDPEALLLFSTVVARADARLFDEILDWLHLNADRLNLQRLTRLHKEHALGDAAVLAAIASQLTRDKAHPKWRPLTSLSSTAGTSVRPLFPHLPPPQQPDETWLARGWQRPPVTLRGLSSEPQPDRPATFLFKLRGLFGLQTRAEVIAWLLAHETGHPAEIARATGYFRGSIQSVLNDLVSSGQIYSRRHGREKIFGLLPADWRFLLTWPGAAEFPRWLPWCAVFGVLQRVHRLLENPAWPTLSAAAQAIELDHAISPGASTLIAAGLWPGTAPDKTPSAHLDRLTALLAQLR